MEQQAKQLGPSFLRVQHVSCRAVEDGLEHLQGDEVHPGGV